MREVPECLSRRYKALDDLVRDLTDINDSSSQRPSCADNMGIKLMCDFWNILKDDPDCNLPEEVQQRMGVEQKSSSAYGQRVNCYMANRELDKNSEEKRTEAMRRIRHITCAPDRSRRPAAKTPSVGSDKLPLSRVLCNLKEAASFDKKCTDRVNELMAAQRELTEQIQILEQRENEGIKLLKQADCMWSCMEETYKKRVAESTERQNQLLKELKEVEASTNKWRKNKKDIEFQIKNMAKLEEELNEKINQKKNDMKVIDMEIENFRKRVESNQKDTEAAKKSLYTKKEASDNKMAGIAAEMGKYQKKVIEAQKLKDEKEKEGAKYVKDAREDLQQICKVLLQKRLENEDLRAEKEALLGELELLKDTSKNCKDKCKIKETKMAEEIDKIELEIKQCQIRCVKCHACTDTIDARKFCTDCPRCLAERSCTVEETHCSYDHSLDCVCMSVKQKFLDNVFDNMYTILERQSKTPPGKAIAEAVMNCLKRSRNGKLNQQTRKILQDFILTTVKKNLNLTIVGGAVKTRCEMDPETYKQLMLCLKDVTVAKPSKEDKSTASKKEPCSRWGGPSECNCPKGPKACICGKKAPPPPSDPTSCGPVDKDDAADVMQCPYKENTACGPDCAMQGVGKTPQSVGIDVASWRPDPCQAQTCPFSKNMRAAQCVLGPEPLVSVTKPHPTPPIIPNLEMLATCSCEEKPTQPCPCHGDRRSQPRQTIIEEVMGRYTEIPPIEKVTSVAEHNFGESNTSRRLDTGCDCSNLPLKYLLASNISDNKVSQFCACSSNYMPLDSRTPYIEKLSKKGRLNICSGSKNKNYEHSLRAEAVQGVRFKTSLVNKPDNDVKVILCPKFPHTYDDKIQLSLGIINTLPSDSTHLRLKSQSSLKLDDDFNLCDTRINERKVCDTVRELIKDIVVPEVPVKNDPSTSNIEWVTIESLFKEITSLTKLQGSSSDTVNEVEVKCETLDALKAFNKNFYDLQSIRFSNNVIEIPPNGLIDEAISSDESFEKESRVSITKQSNIIAEELKTKLIDDIRQAYNISVETSLENIITPKESDPHIKKFKNIRKCLRNLGEDDLETKECNCYVANRKKYDYKYSLVNNRKYYRNEYDFYDIEQSNYPSGINDVKRYLRRVGNIPKENRQSIEIKNKNPTKKKVGFLKPNKSKKTHKKHERYL